MSKFNEYQTTIASIPSLSDLALEGWWSLVSIQYSTVVYICCITAAGKSISTKLGSSCEGNRYGTEKAGGSGSPSITYKIQRWAVHN